MEIIGFIVVMSISLYFLIVLCFQWYWIHYGLGYDKGGVLSLIILLVVGVSIGYIGITNMPFEITFKQ